MFNMLRRIVSNDEDVKMKNEEKKKHKKNCVWSLRYPDTPYDKYIEDHRPFPERKRGNAWFELSGGKEMRDECGKTYFADVLKVVSNDSTSSDALQIEKDLQRTNLIGKSDLRTKEIDDLQQVLKAVSYELRHEGGYCQSMNFIAALLLSHMDNELAFYTQVCINRQLFPKYFTDELTGMRVDERIFLYLLSEKLPVLTDHLNDCDISLTNLTFHWFLCLFINVLPLSVTEYLWDRVFYYGSHVIHAAAMTIFVDYEKELMELDDLEDIVVLLKERLESVTIDDFSSLESLGVSLPRIRMMRIDYTDILKDEEAQTKQNLTAKMAMSATRQMSLRMSIRNVKTTKEESTISDLESISLSVDTLDLILKAVTEYICQHCRDSLGITEDRLSSKYIRDYCHAGLSRDEFLSLWTYLQRTGILPGTDTSSCNQLINEYQRSAEDGREIVDIREVLTGLMCYMSDKASSDRRMKYYFSIYDMKGDGVILRVSFYDFISSVYHDCPDVTDIWRAAEKYVKIIFAVNTQSPDYMTYREFRNLVLIQPQIQSYLELIDDSEEGLENSTSQASEGENMIQSPIPSHLHITELPPILASHPFVLNASNYPEYIQRELGIFLQDIACIVNDRDEMKADISKNNLSSNSRSSYQKSYRLSSNTLLGAGNRQKSVNRSTLHSNMDVINECDELNQLTSTPSPLAVDTKKCDPSNVKRKSVRGQKNRA